MSKLLDEAIEAVRKLPEDRQDAAGALLLSLAEGRDYTLSPEQVEGVKAARADAAKGRFSDSGSVERVFGKRLG